MKKVIFRIVVTFLIAVFFSLGLNAQNYQTHAVTEGETLESISKKYRITPYTIMQYNKEVKSAQDVKPNMVLVIPLEGRPRPQDHPTETKPKEEVQIEPVGFTNHSVKRKETLYSLTKRYDISEEQLKKYNKQLYASGLKKGMVLQIPQFPVVEEEAPLDYETYVVKPKETRWSIAHKYGITVDSLIALNPELPKSTSYLAEGQELQLPRPKGDSLEEQEVILFESYTVPKSIGLFRVSQEYGIPMDSIIRLNPEIAERNGLKEGMVLRLPKRKPKNGAINTENFIFYEVKPKQNIFRLTQNLNISRDSLFALNPVLANGLKAGMVLKLPKAKANGLEVKNALVLDKVSLIDSVNVALRPKLLYLLPFRLNKINLDDSKKAQSQVKSRNDIKYAMGLYTGALVAMDSIKKMGVSVDVKFLDTRRDSTYLKELLRKQSFYDIDAIVGPVDPNLLSEVSVQANSSNVPVIAPFASNSQLGLNNVFFSTPSEAVLRNRLLDYVAQRHNDEYLIVIADEKSQGAKDSILARFPMAQVAKMSEDGSLHLVDFQTMLSEDKENWVFVETDQPSLAASVSSILNASNAETVEGFKIRVKMFTTNYNNAFESDIVSNSHLSNLNFTFPSVHTDDVDASFVKAYRKKFKIAPDRYAARGFDMTFDLLLKLAYKKNLFETSKMIGLTEYSGNRFNYVNDWSSGFFNEGVYLMHYDQLRIKEIASK